jgi:hypothetical protein
MANDAIVSLFIFLEREKEKKKQFIRKKYYAWTILSFSSEEAIYMLDEGDAIFLNALRSLKRILSEFLFFR